MGLHWAFLRSPAAGAAIAIVHDGRSDRDRNAKRQGAGRWSLPLRPLVCLFALLCLAGCNTQSDPDIEGRTPDGTVTMTMAQAAFIGSGSGGSGTLNFRGRTYNFTVGGAGLGGIGASTIQAEGEVYGLTDVAQFPGAYAQGRVGFALGNRSAGNLWLRNGNNVVMALHAARQGLMLSLGADAILISLNE